VGFAVALSADGNTLLVGGPKYSSISGAAWVFTRSGGVWTQQGKLQPADAVNDGANGVNFGVATALSADGNTAIIGGNYDNSNAGAAWIFVRNSGVWTQQGPKLIGSDAVDPSGSGVLQGTAVGISADGNTTTECGDGDDNGVGACWVFTRSSGNWFQQGTKLVGTGYAGNSPNQGWSVAMSGDGNTVIIGADLDGVPGSPVANGAAWIFKRNSGVWSQQGNKFGGTGVAGPGAEQGWSVALSADGSTAAVGGIADNYGAGAAWIFTQPAASRFAVTAPASASANTPFSFTVTALDNGGNMITSYSGKIHFTSSDGSAVLPADASLTNGAGTFSATLKTPGNQTITASDTVVSSIAGTTGAIAVSGGSAVATHFIISAPVSATSGTAFNVTVTAKDAANNTVSGYLGTVGFTSSDGAAVLPANSPLINGTGTFAVTLKTAGSQTISATDTVSSSISGTTGMIAVSGAAAATHLSVSAPATATAGTAFNFAVTAQDAGNNTVAGYSGTVHFTSTDNLAVLPAFVTLTNGTGTFSATLKTGGSRTITAADTVNSSITGTSGSIAVGAGAAASFVVTAPASVTAGTPFSFSVTAQDINNNTVTNYSGTVHFTSSDAAAIVPADSNLISGTRSFTATLKTAGTQTITANDATASSINGTSGTIAVTGGPAARLVVSAPASASAGTAFSLTVTAQDASGNTANGYSGTVHFTSTDGAAVLPANATLTNGAGTFAATLKAAGNQTITATDTVTATITGVSGAITVTGGATATHFAVSAPASATAGAAISFTVTAQDSSNNTVTTYSGTVHFTSSDGAAILPANATLTNGTGTFAATFKTSGSQTITANDTVATAITGTSGGIAVVAGPAVRFAVSTPGSVNAGTAFNFTITAQDANSNTASGYAGTVHFSSSDGSAVLPANSTLVNGTGSFSATLKSAGSQIITAADAASNSIPSTSVTVAVSAGATVRLVVSAPAAAVGGTAFNFTVTAQDANSNVAMSYSGTVHFSSTDGGATLPVNATLANGTGSFAATLKAAGNQTITAIDTVTASITGTSATIAVSGGSTGATHFAISAPSSATSGAPFSFSVIAQDASNNTVSSYSGTVHFSSSDASAVLPANTMLVNGTGAFQATLKTAGNQSISATDSANATISGTFSPILVASGPATHFAVVAPASAPAGSAFNFTVTALDTNNNTAAGYSGTVHFSSADNTAVLPANSALINGTGSFSATLKAPGNQSVTVADVGNPAITGTSALIAVGGGTIPTGTSPGWGSGLGQTMIFTFTDPRGWQDLDVVNILINNFLDGRYGCYLAYSRSAGVLYLVNDPGTALSQGLVLSANGSIANSQCSIDSQGSSVTGNGNVLTLTLKMNFTAAFAGNKVIYLAARDVQGGNSGWLALGAWNVPGTAPTGPAVFGVSPARSSGSGGGTYIFTFTDTNGWQDLGVVNVLVNDFLNGNQACYLAYSRAANALYLVNDTGTGLLPAMQLNGSGSLSNSQCTVSGMGSSFNGSGNSLILTLNISFSPSFGGNRVIYAAARSNGDALNSGWQAIGSRTVQ
jgi:hypothetical protein